MWWHELQFFIMRSYYVYILECADGSYYTGVTSDMDRRLDDHQIGRHDKAYTYTRRPVKLVYVDVTDDVGGAIFREKQIKGWSRKKKQALIQQREELLPKLSRRYSPQPKNFKPKKKYN